MAATYYRKNEPAPAIQPLVLWKLLTKVPGATTASRAVMASSSSGSCSAIAKVSLVGAGMKTNPGVAAKMFETLAAANVNIEMISTSAIRISCIVREGDIERAVQELHTAFGLDAV